MSASSRPASHRPLTPCRMVNRLLPRRLGFTVYTRSENSSTYVPEALASLVERSVIAGGKASSSPLSQRDCSSTPAAIRATKGVQRSARCPAARGSRVRAGAAQTGKPAPFVTRLWADACHATLGGCMRRGSDTVLQDSRLTNRYLQINKSVSSIDCNVTFGGDDVQANPSITLLGALGRRITRRKRYC